MDTITSAVGVCAVTFLGLTAGATAAEGALLIPFWRSMQPEAFLAWYRAHAALLVKFFGPLEVAAGAAAACAATLNWFGHAAAAGLWSLSALLSLAVLAAFPIYFQAANASFAAGTIDVRDVRAELRRYSFRHWVRVVLATGAFILGILAVGQTSVGPAA